MGPNGFPPINQPNLIEWVGPHRESVLASYNIIYYKGVFQLSQIGSELKMEFILPPHLLDYKWCFGLCLIAKRIWYSRMMGYNYYHYIMVIEIFDYFRFHNKVVKWHHICILLASTNKSYIIDHLGKKGHLSGNNEKQ